jgi:cytochrome c5
MKNGLLFLIALTSFGGVTPAFSNGVKTYQQVCLACHASGAANAPKTGDKARWAPLIAEGQVILTAHGYVGVRAMPAKGGKPDLSVEDFSEAVNHMVNQSGGNWMKVNKVTLDAIKKEIVARELAQKPPQK